MKLKTYISLFEEMGHSMGTVTITNSGGKYFTIRLTHGKIFISWYNGHKILEEVSIKAIIAALNDVINHTNDTMVMIPPTTLHIKNGQLINVTSEFGKEMIIDLKDDAEMVQATLLHFLETGRIDDVSV